MALQARKPQHEPIPYGEIADFTAREVEGGTSPYKIPRAALKQVRHAIYVYKSTDHAISTFIPVGAPAKKLADMER
jgi:hypothetical protein